MKKKLPELTPEEKEKILYNYEERVAIGVHDGWLFSIEADAQARNQIYAYLEKKWFGRSNAVYTLYKIIKGKECESA
jgi:hypothetical protein